jgi:single-stranded-DNA-specific exonuclease
MWKIRDNDKVKEEKYLAVVKDRLLARLMSQRNIDVDSVEQFIASDYAGLDDPYALNDLEKGVNIFCEAVKNKGTIGIFGDYDVDGVVSAAMLKEMCNSVGAKSKIFLSSRFRHGYGLNPVVVQGMKDKFGDNPPDVLFVADCGINNEEEILALKEYGIKNVIIIDHHEIDAPKLTKSAEAVINWHIGESQEMCAAGEVFQFIRGLRKKTNRINPAEFLTYAAIATVADASPVVGNNRIIIKHGFQKGALDGAAAAGLITFASSIVGEGRSLNQKDVAFRLAPRINAAGRMYESDVAFGLLTEQDPNMAKKILKVLEGYNDDRKKVQKRVDVEATEMVEADRDKYSHGILVYNKDWHIGIVGIVAARLVDKYGVPTMVFGSSDGVFKGSARTINGIDVLSVMRECSDLFVGFGGHAMAAGATLKDEMAEPDSKAAEMFNEACKKKFSDDVQPEPINLYDASLKASSVGTATAQMLQDRLYPYCNQNNPEPVFLLSNVLITRAELREGATWKMIKFWCEKDGEEIRQPFTSFSLEVGGEIQDCRANVYFMFPQNDKGSLDVQGLELI